MSTYSVPFEVTPKRFLKYYERAITPDSDFYAFVEHPTKEELVAKNATCFLTPDLQAGVITFINADGYLEASCLFNVGPSGQGREVLGHVVLFCKVNRVEGFEGFLTNTYRSLGFKPVERIAFNDDYTQPQWNYERFGRPDLLILRIS